MLALYAVLISQAGVQAEELPDTTAYFVVAEIVPYHGDSYVLPLSDPLDIAFARMLIANGETRIVNALIASGSDGINRDVLAPGMPEWSWHVSEFLEFAENTVEICDGCPTGIEQHLDMWNGQICFWSYTVVWEIPWSVPVEQTTWSRIKQLYHD